tara:strand:- start:2740 stop:2994 length:255 start_codon:yes stop_codon:yes gene_type:complete
MLTIQLKMTDKQYKVLDKWAKSEQRTIENMAAMFFSDGQSSHLYCHEVAVEKIDDDRDPSGSDYQYYKDDELTALYQYLALQQS